MSLFAFLGAIETGLVFGIVALGVYLSFRILSFPDLTVDGSFPLGACLAVTLIAAGADPWTATLLAILAGALAGLVTAVLNVRFGILHLLASILTMIALYSVNLRIMGRPNLAIFGKNTVLTPFETLAPSYILTPIVFAVAVLAVVIVLNGVLHSRLGLSMRAVGVNPRMARAQGASVAALTLGGMALSNALVAFGGALFAQAQGSADVSMGVGTIIVGLAAVIGGETLIRPKTILAAIIACIVGSILYRLAIAAALDTDILGLKAQDLNLITAVLVAVALIASRIRRKTP